MPRYGFDFGQPRQRDERRIRNYANEYAERLNRWHGTVNRAARAVRHARRARDAIHAFSRGFSVTTGGAAIGKAAQFISDYWSDSDSIHYSSDGSQALVQPTQPPPAQAGPQYKKHRPPKLNLQSTQRYRDWPGPDPSIPQFGRNWLYLSATRSTQRFTHPSLSANRKRVKFGSPRTRRKALKTIRRALRPFILKRRLAARHRQRRGAYYLATDLRQAARRVLDLQKKYIIAHRIYKPAIRKNLAAAKRALYIARRRYRNAFT